MTAAEASTGGPDALGLRRRASALAGRRASVSRHCIKPLVPHRGDGLHVLLADSDERLTLRLSKALRASGYWVTTAHTPNTVQALLNVLVFDAIVASENMAGLWVAGLELSVSVPIETALIVSRTELRPGLLNPQGAVVATHPTILARLATAMHACASAREGETTVILGEARFDLATRQLTQGGAVIALTPHEARVLWTLAIQAHAPVRRDILRPEAQGRGVDITVMRLRRRLEPMPREPIFLRTVRGIGYVLTPTAIAGPPRAPVASAQKPGP